MYLLYEWLKLQNCSRSSRKQEGLQVVFTANFSNLAEMSKLETPSPLTWPRLKQHLEVAALHLWFMKTLSYSGPCPGALVDYLRLYRINHLTFFCYLKKCTLPSFMPDQRLAADSSLPQMSSFKSTKGPLSSISLCASISAVHGLQISQLLVTT